MRSYALGLDFGTNSVRALVVDVKTGDEAGTSVCPYAQGEAGILLHEADPELARQHPRDYLDGLEAAVKGALAEARERAEVDPCQVIGIGVDTTGSTPLPVDEEGRPLAMSPRFGRELAAMAWLWKDHTAHAEAEEITARARVERPAFLERCGGVYSSEWFWSKLLHCRRTAPHVFEAAHTWVEIADWIPAVLTGTDHPRGLKRGICAAGHKAMFHPSWGGYPDEAFLSGLDPELARVRRTLPSEAYHVGNAAGELTPAWAERLGLTPGLPVAVGAFDAHLGAVGAGIREGVLVKIMGTSTCDMAVAPLEKDLPLVPGLCGIVPESILPGHHGLEAGQSAVGDIFDWFVRRIRPGGARAGSHAALTRGARALRPGESGLLALDWWNGNRTVLVDQRLTGLVAGFNLHTTPAELYRALVEATAFGARVILERIEEYGVPVERVVACGGIPAKNPFVMQVYADILNRPIAVSRSDQTCALGAAMAGAVVAGSHAGGYGEFHSAARAMTGLKRRAFKPDPAAATVYHELYGLYRRVHDAFGIAGYEKSLHSVMKELLRIRDAAREAGKGGAP